MHTKTPWLKTQCKVAAGCRGRKLELSWKHQQDAVQNAGDVSLINHLHHLSTYQARCAQWFNSDTVVRGDKLLSDLRRGILHKEFLPGTKHLVKVRVTVKDICPRECCCLAKWTRHPLKIYSYTYSSVEPSPLAREASVCNGELPSWPVC